MLIDEREMFMSSPELPPENRSRPVSDAPDATRSPHEPASSEQQKSEPESEEARLLEQVVEETLLAGGTESVLEPGELEALRAVARRLKNSRLRLQTIAVELVNALLASRFGKAIPGDSDRQAVAEQISRVLLDDEESSGRLERMWQRLCGESK